MTELQEGITETWLSMLELNFLRSLGIEPNFADVSRHVKELLAPLLDTTDNESEISKLKADNEELSYNCEELENRIYSIARYTARMRKQIEEMNFEGKGEIEAILSDIEDEL